MLRKIEAYYEYLIKESLNEDLRNNFYQFFKFFWEEIENDNLVDNWHIKYLCDELQIVTENMLSGKPKLYDLCINVPPGSTKSRIFSVAFPVWAWLQKPQLRFITTSGTSDLASEFAIKARTILKSDYFKTMYPDITISPAKDRIDNFETVQGGIRYSMGFGGTITGLHADFIIIDDPHKAGEIYSKAKRVAAERALRQTLSGRMTDKSKSVMILVMQRLHADDLTTHFLKFDDVKHIVLPGELTDEIKPTELRDKYKEGLFDPIRLPRPILEKEKVKLGSSGYAAQIRQNPQDVEASIFKREWWGRYTELSDFDIILQFWDTAYEEKEENDYSACATWGVNKNGIYLINIFRDKLIFPKLKSKFIDKYREYEPNKVYIEDAGSGKSLLQDLKYIEDEAIPLYEVKPKNKIVRAHAVTSFIEAGNVYIPEKAHWLEDYLAEITAFPNALHDDMVDVTTMGLEVMIPIYRGINSYVPSNSNLKKKKRSSDKLKGML
jgi:predicted phage terminase large subunit-like protein